MYTALGLKEYDDLEATIDERRIVLKPSPREPGWREKLTKGAPQRSKRGNRRKASKRGGSAS